MEPSREIRIKSIALEVGFSVVGIADVSAHEKTNHTFDRWLSEGMNAGMDYLVRHREKRRAPSLLLEGAKSAICVGLNYYLDIEKTQKNADGADGRGMFSIYAQSRDYHQVMDEMLGRLKERLEELFPGVRTVACVDTKPISDRSMAIRAGVGWLGKNSSVISNEFGSWIFLGELLTDLDLRPDQPLVTLCGKCTRCIDACPTGALDVPFAVDARKCISYLTVEHRGAIPPELHEKIGLHVYGCDTCQSVCPFNDLAVESIVFDRRDRSRLVDTPVEELERISDEEFAESTRNTAIRRCKSDGMRRNAAIVHRNIEVRGRSRPR
jgi:epoxyqueuosine reductase